MSMNNIKDQQGVVILQVQHIYPVSKYIQYDFTGKKFGDIGRVQSLQICHTMYTTQSCKPTIWFSEARPNSSSKRIELYILGTDVIILWHFHLCSVKGWCLSLGLLKVLNGVMHVICLCPSEFTRENSQKEIHIKIFTFVWVTQSSQNKTSLRKPTSITGAQAEAVPRNTQLFV